MKQHKFKLYVSPGSCARVPTIALEEIGTAFETEIVRMMAKQQKSPEYLAINPKGKVPALLIDNEPLTENVAILTWLNNTYPEAGLLPPAINHLETVRQIADLAFFSGTIHPFVTRIARPEKFVTDTEIVPQVRQIASQAVVPFWKTIDERLSTATWWYDDRWSIVDGYLFWAWWRIGVCGFNGDDFPNIQAHAERIIKRPSVKRAMEREAVYIEQLKSEGLYEAPR
jgi:glutathione S-transferase